jgi:hypothetical protein
MEKISCAENIYSSFIRIMWVDFEHSRPAPTIIGVTTQTQARRIDLQVELSAKGFVGCAAYDPSHVPTSSFEIKVESDAQPVDTLNRTSIAIVNLLPGRQYDIYCITYSVDNNLLSLAFALKTKLRIFTSCCKQIFLSLNSKVIIGEYFETSDVFGEFVLEAPPSSVLDVVVTITRFNPMSDNTSTSVSVFPYTSQFYPSSASLTQRIYINGVAPGLYNISVTALGPSGSEFTNATDYFEVLGPQFPFLPAPAISSAKVTNDGSSIVFIFNVATDRGLQYGQFNCSSIFDIRKTASFCQWVDDKSLYLRLNNDLAREKDSPLIHGYITLLAGTIRAKCVHIDAGCAAWAAASAQSLSIQPPDAPLRPLVAIDAPETLGECDAVIRMDMRTSFGSAGRAWHSVNVSLPSLSYAHAANSYLRAQQKMDSLVVSLPITLLPSNASYVFVVTMCNDLGVCGHATHALNILPTSVPLILLPHSTSVLQRRHALNLQATASVQSCAGVRSAEHLVYSWVVSRGGLLDLGLKTESREPNKFTLSHYRLEAGHSYQIQLDVSHALTGAFASRSVQVFVRRSALVANIQGGVVRSVESGKLLVLNGSSSRDLDVDPATVIAGSSSVSGLSYSWTCVRLKPTRSSVCGLQILQGGNTRRETVQMTGSAAGDEFEWTLTVTAYSANAMTRTAQVSVLVRVAPSSTKVSLDSTALRVAARSERLALGATVRYEGGIACQWTVNDSALALAQRALTPLTFSGPAPAAAAAAALDGDQGSLVVASFSLVLPAGTLVELSTYLFTLQCTTSSGYTAEAAVRVAVNSGPRPGQFLVNPSLGSELSTEFHLSAELWEDLDGSIEYLFGFLPTTQGAFMKVNDRSESTETFSTLPASLDEEFLTCVLHTFDTLGASTIASFSVKVMRSSTDLSVVSTAVQTSLALIATPDAKAFSESTLDQTLSTVGVMLNRVDCSRAPDCSILNRHSCSTTKHTCGYCKATHSFGTQGHSNSKCFENASGVSKIGNSCTSGNDCGDWESCVSFVCQKAPKNCRGAFINEFPFFADCSGHGTCSYKAVTMILSEGSSSATLEKCFEGDTTCEPSCTCVSGWDGDACDKTTSEADTRKQIRNQLLIGLSTSMQLKDHSSSNLQTWAGNLDLLSRERTEMTPTSIALTSQIAQDLLLSAKWAGVALDQSSVIDVLSTLASTSTTTSAIAGSAGTSGAASIYRSRRRTQSSASDIVTLVKLFADVAMRDFQVGERTVVFIRPSLRLVLTSVSSLSSQLRIEEPRLALEAVQNPTVPSLTVPVGSQNLKVALYSIPRTVFGEAVQSHALGALTDISVCGLGASCNVTVLLPTTTVAVPTVFPSVTPPRFSRSCASGDYSTLQESCPAGYLSDSGVVNASLTCPGTAGTMETACPTERTFSSCSALLDAAPSDVLCTGEPTSEYGVRCNCFLRDVKGVGAKDFVYAAVRHTVMQQEPPKFTPIAPDAATEKGRGIGSVLIISCSVAGAALLALLLLYTRHIHIKAKQKKVNSELAQPSSPRFGLRLTPGKGKVAPDPKASSRRVSVQSESHKHWTRALELLSRHEATFLSAAGEADEGKSECDDQNIVPREGAMSSPGVGSNSSYGLPRPEDCETTLRILTSSHAMSHAIDYNLSDSEGESEGEEEEGQGATAITNAGQTSGMYDLSDSSGDDEACVSKDTLRKVERAKMDPNGSNGPNGDWRQRKPIVSAFDTLKVVQQWKHFSTFHSKKTPASASASYDHQPPQQQPRARVGLSPSPAFSPSAPLAVHQLYPVSSSSSPAHYQQQHQQQQQHHQQQQESFGQWHHQQFQQFQALPRHSPLNNKAWPAPQFTAPRAAAAAPLSPVSPWGSRTRGPSEQHAPSTVLVPAGAAGAGAGTAHSMPLLPPIRGRPQPIQPFQPFNNPAGQVGAAPDSPIAPSYAGHVGPGPGHLLPSPSFSRDSTLEGAGALETFLLVSTPVSPITVEHPSSSRNVPFGSSSTVGVDAEAGRSSDTASEGSVDQDELSDRLGMVSPSRHMMPRDHGWTQNM